MAFLFFIFKHVSLRSVCFVFDFEDIFYDIYY